MFVFSLFRVLVVWKAQKWRGSGPNLADRFLSSGASALLALAKTAFLLTRPRAGTGRHQTFHTEWRWTLDGWDPLRGEVERARSALDLEQAREREREREGERARERDEESHATPSGCVEGEERAKQPANAS